MTRRSILSTLAVMAALIAVIGSQRVAGVGQAERRIITVEKVKDNLFVMRGGGGNTAVFIGTSGVTVVDTKLPGWGQPLIDEIRKITDKPITTIINTHTHADHVSGNIEFPANVEVIAQDSTAANMKKMVPPSGLSTSAGAPVNVFKDGSVGMPKRTFSYQLSLGRGADQINLYHFGRGHTNGDIVVEFPAARVAHAGDLFAGKSLPLLDANNGGSGLGIPDTLSIFLSTLGAKVDSIITGHSTNMTSADLKEYVALNREFLDAVRAGKEAGQTVDQIAASWSIPSKYAGYAPVEAQQLRNNVRVTFDEIK